MTAWGDIQTIYKRYTNDIPTAWGGIQTIYKRSANVPGGNANDMQSKCEVYDRTHVCLFCSRGFFYHLKHSCRVNRWPTSKASSGTNNTEKALLTSLSRVKATRYVSKVTTIVVPTTTGSFHELENNISYEPRA